MIDIECPNCQTSLEVADSSIGTNVQCSNCGNSVLVPADSLTREERRIVSKSPRPFVIAIGVLVALVVCGPMMVHALYYVATILSNETAQEIAIPWNPLFTSEHEEWIADSLDRNGMELINTFCVGNTVVVDAVLPLETLEATGRSPKLSAEVALLEARNQLYSLASTDKNWDYFLTVKGESPGPGLEYVYGYCQFTAETGTLDWSPDDNVQKEFEWFSE